MTTPGGRIVLKEVKRNRFFSTVPRRRCAHSLRERGIEGARREAGRTE